MDINAVEQIYHLYGFETKKIDSTYGVFLYSSGYFRNIEIVYETETDIVTEIINEYQKLKFPVNQVLFSSIEKLHEDLFYGFFLVSELSEKLKRKYEAFVTERNFIDEDYQYVPCTYYKNGKDSKDNIIDFLFQQITEDTASLTILEAAAGYGKTCTISELMNKISQSNNTSFVPLFVELSNNRNARIFKYVLLDEIDRNFSNLSSDLVTAEIKYGNVPLIIDGFDELLASLADSDKLDSDTIEKTQTMLQTIIELFEGNSKAKIIITSRKTSLISGRVLDDLMLQLDDCPITRITLKEPTINEWLDNDKISFLEKENIPLQQFSNPILLKFLQRTKISDFTHSSFSVKKILKQNLIALLHREIERQQLQLSEEEQEEIFIKFAAFLMDFQISSEEPSFIFDAFKEILAKQVSSYLARYTDSKTRPNENEFIGKLTRHVLLDTNKSLNNQIGFTNDFIFGLYLAKVVNNPKYLRSGTKVSADHIDKICTTYRVMPKNDRTDLFKKLQPYLSKFDGTALLQIDAQINNYLTQDYNQVQIDSQTFDSFDFSIKHKIDNSIFANCIFKSCIWGNNTINCQFINCSFFDNYFSEEEKFIYGQNNFFYNSQGIEIDHSIEYHPQEEITVSLERQVLEVFWKPSHPTYDRYKHTKTIFLNFQQSQLKDVANAIEQLKKKKYLLQPGYCLEINNAKITEIRNLLGR